MIVFYHTAYRDPQPQPFQHAEGNIYLSFSSVHQKEIRHSGKAVELAAALMGKTPRQHFLHTGVIIRTLNGFNAEFTVIAAFRPAFFVNHHGTYGFESADIGDIKCFHTADIRKSQPALHLADSADRPSLFSFHALSVLIQNHLRIFPGKLYQFLLGTFLRHDDMHFLLSPGRKPFFNDLRIFHLRLEHDLSGNKRRSRIKLFQEAG